ncbi:MAG: ABC transporter ATP-binding protein [Desulfobulbus sp.]|jgi:branched-chain amino acid transport system ATP-binding protein|uniref:ABC transporter ATP-binding protein n=1 Tax=Desulfobulbus sp. TaxID=895 RepID=UPI00284DD30E|nr:ABC transporter ATP-binding protein [Desulfobulbus sp.]MDR2549366.1 ABC transporter ATP-binding protein [Desulfobulbus sp.]
MHPLLIVSGLTMDFGGIRALDRMDLRILPGEIVALIGPNGAGKTTLFNCLTGMYRPTGGQVLLNPPGRPQRRLHGLSPHRITAAGLARTFQNIRLFPNMTVLENVMVGRHCRTTAKLFGAIFRPSATVREERETVGMCLALLDRIGLIDQADELARNLPYGAQRRLEIARALATGPQLLLLDEPAAGMNPQETAELEALIASIRGDGLSILLIEHDMKLVMRLSDHIFAMDFGCLIAEGTPDEVRRHPAVIRAYLGEETTDA